VKHTTDNEIVMPRQITLPIKETAKKIKITNLAEPLEGELIVYGGARINIPLGFSEICLCSINLPELFQNSWERCPIMTFIINDNVIKEHRTEKAEEQWFRIRTELQTSEPSRYETLAEEQQIPIVETYASNRRLHSLEFLLRPKLNILTWISWTDRRYSETAISWKYTCGDPERHSKQNVASHGNRGSGTS
jgi:hypothetical protein